jgi:DNA-directed RNA polymerase
MQTVDKKIEVDELGHSTFTFRAEVNQPMKKGLSLAANVVHSIDGWIVREMYKRAKKQGFDIVTIHDSFWCHPNHVNQMRANYIHIMGKLAQMNLLETILSELKGSTIKVKKTSTSLHRLIHNAEYALS